MPLLRWTRHSGVTVFPSARGSKKPLSRRGRKPEDLKGAPQRSRRVEWLLVHDFGENVPTGLELARRRFSERARNQKSLPRRGRKPEGLLVRVRGTYIAETPEACLWGFCYIGSPDWTRTSNPSINSRMLCQLSYGGLFCFRCWFPLQRVITIPGLFGLRNLKCYEVHHSLDWELGLRLTRATPPPPAVCGT